MLNYITMTLGCVLGRQNYSTYSICVAEDMDLGKMNYSTPVDWLPSSVDSNVDSSDVSISMSTTYSPQMLGENSPSQSFIPKLTINEEPQEKFRFRYKSEMMGTHGCILGRKSDRLLKTYPQVKLSNYNEGPAIIRCSLVAFIGNNKEPVPHAHRLIVRVHDVDREEPQEIIVDEQCSYTAIFQGMGIVHTAKKYVVEELVKKKRKILLDVIKGQRGNDATLSVREEMRIKEEAQSEAKVMNLNIVNLCFEALYKDDYGNVHPICDKVYSTSIRNMKCAQTGELKICRIDKHVSSCIGGEEVFILVEKVGKKNIQVRFFELDEEDNEIWEDFGKFTELDVHHQYAVVFRTPRYRDVNIEQPVDVFLQLFRPSDKDTSEPIRFTYKPRETVGRKRLRSQISYDTTLPTAVVQGFLHKNESGFIGLDHLGTQLNSFITNQSSEINKLHLTTNITIGGNTNILPMNPNTPDGWQDITIDDLMAENNLSENCLKNFANLGYLDVLEDDLAVDCGSFSSPKGSTVSFDDDLTTDCVRVSSGKGPIHTLKRETIGSTIITPDVDETMISAKKKLRSNPFSLIVLKQIRDCGWNTESFRRFLERTTVDGNRSLHLVVTFCQNALLEKLLEIMKNRKLFSYVDEKNELHQTPLHLAVMIKDWQKVRFLLDAGARPELQDIKGNTAFHLAVMDEHITDQREQIMDNHILLNPCLKELLDKKNYTRSTYKASYLNLTNEAGMTPLQLAVSNENARAVTQLLQAGCDVNHFDDHGGCSALHMAIVSGSVPIIKLLLSQVSINLEYCNRRNINALQLATLFGGNSHDEILRILKEKMNVNEETVKKAVSLSGPEEDGDESDDCDESSENHLEENCTQPEDGEVAESLLGLDSGCVLDEGTMTQVSHILDASGRWRDLAKFLDFDFLISIVEEQASPARAVLNYADIHGGISMKSLKEILDMLGEESAAKEIEQVILKKK